METAGGFLRFCKKVRAESEEEIMLNNNSFQKDPGSKILLLAAFCLLTLTATARGAGCSAVDFSVTFKSVLHTNPNGISSGDGIAEADFNRDGNLDMAVTNAEAGTVNIYLGDGKGGFTVSTLTSAEFPRSVFARDFNRDGKTDLLVTSIGATLFIGNGSGGFTLGGTITTSGGLAVAVADFNLDGLEDFVIQNNSNLAMFLGNGNGTFANPILTPQTNSVVTATAADFNRDGKPDLVLAAFSNAQVFFLPGNGAGGFGAIVSFNVSFGDIRFLTAEDLNGDGRLDLIVGGSFANAKILLGAATGVFTVSNSVNAASDIRNIQTADYNDDGKVDLLLLLRAAPMEVRPGNGDGTFAAAALTTAIDAVNAVQLTAADFNNDGKIDFAATDINEVFVGLNRCGGLTQKPDVDFTGDGRADIAFFRPSSGSWFILRSEDNSFFSFPFGLNGDIPVAADYDGDGKSDAAVFRPSAATWFISRSGDGGTTFVQFGVSTDTPAPSDYDGDGKADIAIFRPSVGEWWILRSSDGSVFATQFGANGDIPIR